MPVKCRYASYMAIHRWVCTHGASGCALCVCVHMRTYTVYGGARLRSMVFVCVCVCVLIYILLIQGWYPCCQRDHQSCCLLLAHLLNGGHINSQIWHILVLKLCIESTLCFYQPTIRTMGTRHYVLQLYF